MILVELVISIEVEKKLKEPSRMDEKMIRTEKWQISKVISDQRVQFGIKLWFGAPRWKSGSVRSLFQRN